MTTHQSIGEPRLNLPKAMPEAYKALGAAEMAVRNSALDATIRELVKLRASQMNGCVHCVDIHSHEALELGESLDRILQLVAWRESPLYTPLERAALEYTEAATVLGPHGVADDVWSGVRDALDDKQLGALVVQVALINAFNRFGVPLQMPVRQRS